MDKGKAKAAERSGERQRGGRATVAPDLAARERLLHATGELMTERRSTDVSLNDISNRCGVNSAMVKYYFGSKFGLMVELLRKVLGPAIIQLRHLADMPKSPQEKLRIHISGMANSYLRYPYVNQLMHQLLAEDPATFGPLIATEFSKPIAEVQGRILQEGIASGLFKDVDPMMFYFHVIGACDQLFFGRYQMEHVFGVDEIDDALRRRFVDHLCAVIFDGIVKRPPDAAKSY